MQLFEQGANYGLLNKELLPSGGMAWQLEILFAGSQFTFFSPLKALLQLFLMILALVSIITRRHATTFFAAH